MNIIRWYIDASCCLCTDGKRTQHANHIDCSAMRKELEGTEGSAIARTLLSLFFENVNPASITDVLDQYRQGEDGGGGGEKGGIGVVGDGDGDEENSNDEVNIDGSSCGSRRKKKFTGR